MSSCCASGAFYRQYRFSFQHGVVDVFIYLHGGWGWIKVKCIYSE